ncbi:MAG: GAF domain-containing sensor histidine kinase [Sphaerobacter sp.]|nr:GAF domain-containing sensor histidine kinase [Sphaerobacter sp.]
MGADPRSDAATTPGDDAGWRHQLESLYAMSVEISGLRQVDQVMDRALGYCLQLTQSEFGFVGLAEASGEMQVAAVRGFVPDRPDFWERFRRIPIRRTILGVTILDGAPTISNDVAHDPGRRGVPRGHPPVRTFLGVPLKVREETIGMLGVANRPGGYGPDHQRLLATFAAQVAVAIDNARLYERQQTMIADLRALHARLDAAEVQAMLHQERHRIAEELHDRVAQIMFSIGMAATWCRERTPPGEVRATLDRVRDLAARGAAEIRRAVYDLAAEEGPPRGLVAKLREAVAGATCVSGPRIDLIVDGQPRRLPVAVEEALSRVAAEALRNVQRHSGATLAIVSLRFEPEQVTLVVQDNGVGLPRALDRERAKPGTFGLRAMQRRLEAVGGRLALRNADDGGLVVRATVPLLVEGGEA